MSTYTYTGFKKAVKKSGVTAVFEDGWNSPQIDPFGVSPSAGVVLHFTGNGGAKGNAPSLYWCKRNQYYPVRAAHFLIGRDGTVHVLSGRGSYHAGAGGPMKVGDTWVPQDQGNKYLVGIEIESKGTDNRTDAAESDVDGFTKAQVKATVLLTAAMCELMGTNHRGVIRHRDWAPGRKPDVGQDLKWWRKKIKRQLRKNKAKRAIGLGK